MEASALNDNRSYPFFPNESASTSYSNESPIVYYNESSTFYSNESDTPYSNESSTSYSNESSTSYSNKSSTSYSNESSTAYSKESSTFYSNESSTSYSNATTTWPDFWLAPNSGPETDWSLISDMIILYGFPPVVILGVVGNVLMVTVVIRLRARRSTMDQFLAAIAISDTVFLLALPKITWWSLVTGVHVYSTHDILCKGLHFANKVTPTLSAWLVVAMTTQRAVAVVWPHRVGVLCTGRRTWVLILALTLFYSLLYSHIFYGIEVYHYDWAFEYKNCVPVSESYAWFANKVFVYIEAFLFSYIPAVCLLAGNAVLIVKLRQAGRDVGKTLADASSSSSAAQLHSRARDTQSISVTVIAMSLAFLGLTFPHTIYNILPYNGATMDTIRYSKYFVGSLTTMTLTLNYSINFYLYCLTGARFRNEFKRMVLCVASRGQQRHP